MAAGVLPRRGMRFCCAGLRSKPGASASAGALPAVMPAMLSPIEALQDARAISSSACVPLECEICGLSGSRRSGLFRSKVFEGIDAARIEQVTSVAQMNMHLGRQRRIEQAGVAAIRIQRPGFGLPETRWLDKRAYNPGRAHAVLVPARRGARGPDGAHRRVSRHV